jgi:hypothetical protein
MLRLVALIRTDISEEHSASIFRMTRIGELRTLQEPHGINIPEDDILHSHRCEKLKSYTAFLIYTPRQLTRGQSKQKNVLKM